MPRLFGLMTLVLSLAVAGPASAQTRLVNGSIDITIEEIGGREFITNLDFPFQHLKVTNNSSSSVTLTFNASLSGGYTTPNIFPQLAVLYLDPGESNYLTSYLDAASGDLDLYNLNLAIRTWLYTFTDASTQSSVDYATIWALTTFPEGVSWPPDTSPFGTITGRVSTAEGAGVAGAQVELLSARNAGGAGFSVTTTTGADGSFSLTMPYDRDWFFLRVTADGYLTAFKTIDPDNLSDVQVTITPGDPGSPRLTTVSSMQDLIGFWRGKASADGSRFLLIQGMEMWDVEDMKGLSQLKLFDADGNTLWAHYMGQQGWAADLSRDGAYAVYATLGGDGHYALVDASNGQVLWQKNLADLPTWSQAPLPDKRCREIVFNNAGDKIALGTDDGGVFFLDRADGQITASVFLKGMIRQIAFKADDSVAYVSSGDGYLYAVDPTSGSVIWKSYGRAWFYTRGLALSSDGTYIAGAAKTGYGCLFRASDGEKIFEHHMGSLNAAVAVFHPQDEGVFFGSMFRSGYFDLIGQIRWYAPRAQSAVFSPGGEYVVIGGHGPGSLRVIHTASGTEVGDAFDQTQIDGNVTWLYLSPDGSRLYVATENGNVVIYNCSW